MTAVPYKEMAFQQTTIIEHQRGWQLIDWPELFKYKDLLYFLVWRDVGILYKQTILGFAWAIIRPFIGMIVFSVVFGKLAKMPSDGVPYPIFSYAALVPWTYFSAAMAESSSSLMNSAHMLSKVYFPRLYIPLTPIFTKLVDFVIALSILVLMMFWYGIVPSLNVLLLPFFVLVMILTAAGIGMWLSSLGIQYRDVRHATHFLSQILMYAAPVVWPVSLIPAQYRLLYGIFPMAGVIEGFRSALLGTTPMPWDLILTGALSAILLASTGALYFRRTERIFADVA